MSNIINIFIERITKAGYPSNNNTWKKSGNKIYFTRYNEDYDISMTKEEQKFNTKFVNKLFSICDKMTKVKIAYYNVDENNKGKCVLTFTPFSKSIKESMIYGYMLESKKQESINESYIIESVEGEIQKAGSKEALMKRYRLSNDDINNGKRFLNNNPGLFAKFKQCKSIKDIMHVMKSKDYKDALAKEK